MSFFTRVARLFAVKARPASPVVDSLARDISVSLDQSPVRPSKSPPQVSGLRFQIASSALLRSYFYSGWAFLIPYLFAYLLYAWLKWPVNPSSVAIAPSPAIRPPCLLHVYWTLHIVHLLLAAFALRVWWKESAPRLQPSTSSDASQTRSGSPTHRSLATVLWSLAPWACLALIFWIPGIYLEFPADTWAHVGRITLWEQCAHVRDHATWTKSAYFLYASMLPPSSTGYGPRLVFLNLLTAGTGLLLCWQQYRLAHALSIRRGAAFLFVLLQLFMMGSSSFSFYRYYSLSSTIVGQLAATALVVILIRRLHPSGSKPSHSMAAFVLALIGLGLLAAMNHPQSVAIAGVSGTAVIAARCFVRKPRFAWSVFPLTFVGTILVIAYYPRHEMLDHSYVPDGWLTRIYSFNLFSPSGPAVARSIDLLGMAGILNVFVALALMRRHFLASVLCLAPFVALLLPMTALPFASALARGLETPIRMFHRLYLAVPAGLALVLGAIWVRERLCASLIATVAWSQTGLLLALLALSTIPGNYPWLNRSYHLLMRPAADASYAASLRRFTSQISPDRLLIATPGEEYVAAAWYGQQGLLPLRLPGTQATARVLTLRSAAAPTGCRQSVILPVAPLLPYTSASTMAQISRHWSAVAVALDHTVPDQTPVNRQD